MEIKLSELESTLPPDYLELVSQFDGATLDTCSVLGLNDIYEVVFHEDTLIILVDFMGESGLVALQDTSDGATYYAEYKGDELVRQSSFREALINSHTSSERRAFLFSSFIFIYIVF